ncbi:hypothetical protein ACFE04_015437 [Oxalis oulophora]
MEKRSPKILVVERSPRTILEKLPPKSPVLYERYKSGCAWKLLSFLDFCQSHSNKKANSHTRQISSYTSGNEYISKLLKLRKDLDKKSNNVRADTKSLTSDATEHRTKKKVSTTKKVQSDSNLTHDQPKKHKKSGKSFSRPCSTNDVAIVGPERPSDKKSERLASTTGTEEICNKMNHQTESAKVNSPVNNDQLSEINLQVRMNESAEAFINQQLIDKDGANQQSKKLLDALEIMNSNKDLFIKLLQDPNSLLVKHIQDLKHDHGKSQQNKSLSEAQLSECQLSNEKLKSFDSRFCKDLSDDPSDIVLLKPRRPIMNSAVDNSSEFHPINFDHGLMNKGQSVKPTVFSLDHVKRRLRHAIGVRRMAHALSDNKRDPTSEAKDTESGFRHEVCLADESGQSISNLSIVRHNKHSEDDTGDEVLRTHDYRRDKQHGSATVRMRYSPYSSNQVVDEIKRKHLSALADMKKRKPDVLEKFPKTKLHESICSRDDITKPCHREFVKAVETNGLLSLEGTDPLEIPVESGGMQIDEVQYSKCSDVDTALEIDSPPHREYACSSNPLFTRDDADPPDLKDKTEDPSTSSISEQLENTVTPKTNEYHSESHLRSPDEYGNAVLRTSDFNWDDFLKKSLPTVQQLDVENMQNLSHSNPRLVDDYISEVSRDVYQHCFRCCPWMSIIDTKIRPLPTENDLVSVMKKHIDLDLVSPVSLPTLEQLAAKDLAKAGNWLDNLQLDLEDTVIEMVDSLMEELVTELWTEATS